MAIKTNLPAARWPILRFTTYTLILSAVLELIVLSQARMRGNDVLFEEEGFIETTQLGLLVMSSLILFAASLEFRNSRHLYRIMAIMPLIAVVRELDNVFDR